MCFLTIELFWCQISIEHRKTFTHYWQFTALEKKAQLKHLRKTYLTALVQQFGEKANLISSHSGIDVLKKHYVNDQELMKATREFRVY